MIIEIGSEIRIRDASDKLKSWAKDELIVLNPQYQQRERRGLWLGNMPKYLWLFRLDGSDLIVPTGVGKQIKQFLSVDDQINVRLADNGLLEYQGNIPLYDYQKTAVEAMRVVNCGILQSPCGSGKTQMGIALIALISRKALWITHTQDLLTQSKARAEQYFQAEIMGVITAGKVQIGSHITFATVQTLSKLDLTQYRDTWDVVIVDECHRLAGFPTQITMFYKVINSLAARYKYGLSATVHRSDGTIKSTFAALGPIIYKVPDTAVQDKTMKVRICRRNTGTPLNRCCLDTDGTLIYSELLSCLGESRERNGLIAKDLVQQNTHSCLVLASRLKQLQNIRAMLPEELQEASVMIDGHMTGRKGKAEREAAIKDMQEGKKSILFASFGLAKEGLDIPRLDRLFLVSPQKDYAVVTQSIGRIARKAEGKTDAVCYDYVDDIQFCENQFRKRVAHYRKAGCIL